MLKNNIPNVAYNLKQIKDLIDAIQPEIDYINQRIQDLKLDLFLSTTSIIEKFELDYGIVPDDSKSKEDRILGVINKKNLYKTFTKERANELVKSNYKSDKFVIEYDYPNYSFNVLLKDDKPINLLREAMDEAKPAHLFYFISLLIGKSAIKLRQRSYIISKLVRRCGTFNCGVNPL